MKLQQRAPRVACSSAGRQREDGRSWRCCAAVFPRLTTVTADLRSNRLRKRASTGVHGHSGLVRDDHAVIPTWARLKNMIAEAMAAYALAVITCYKQIHRSNQLPYRTPCSAACGDSPRVSVRKMRGPKRKPRIRLGRAWRYRLEQPPPGRRERRAFLHRRHCRNCTSPFRSNASLNRGILAYDPSHLSVLWRLKQAEVDCGQTARRLLQSRWSMRRRPSRDPIKLDLVGAGSGHHGTARLTPHLGRLLQDPVPSSRRARCFGASVNRQRRLAIDLSLAHVDDFLPP